MEMYIEDLKNSDKGVKIIKQKNNLHFRFYVTKHNEHISEHILNLFNTEMKTQELEKDMVDAIYDLSRSNNRIAYILNENNVKNK